MQTRSGRQCLRMIVLNSLPADAWARLFSCSSSCFWKAGDSSSFSRMYRPIRPSGPAIRNGIRQPQESISASVSARFNTVTSAEPSA